MKHPKTSIPWPLEKTLELLTLLRNDLIGDLLNGNYLREYIQTRFQVRDLSRIKVEFIRMALKQLRQSALDRMHYESLVREVMERGTTSLAAGNDQLFYQDVDRLLQRFLPVHP
jgi:hypothetical protein